MKKTFFSLVTAFALLVTFTACENAAPEINFSQSTTVAVDLTDVIDAINDMSTSMETKLDLIRQALESSNTSLADKLDILIAAIETQTIDLNGKLDAIETAVEQSVIDLNAQMDLVKDALIASLENEFAKNDSILEESNKKFDALNKALTLVGVEAGIMPQSNRDTLFMHPTAWDVISKDEEIYASFTRVMRAKATPIDAGTPCVYTSVIYPQSWKLVDVKATPDTKTLGLYALHQKQTADMATPTEVVVYTYGTYKVEAAIPEDKKNDGWNFTGQKFILRYSHGTGAYWPNGGVTENAETGKYELTHTLDDGAKRMSLYPKVHFGVKQNQAQP